LFLYEIIPATLKFAFPAGTSRGILTEKPTWFLKLWDDASPDCIGWGEAGLLQGLSPENQETFFDELTQFLETVLPHLDTKPRAWENLSSRWMESTNAPWLPSAFFALETAWLDWVNGGKRLICAPEFHAGLWSVPLNGLVWMNPRATMEQQARQKVGEGFETLKLKVGALDWHQELDMLAALRSEFPAKTLSLRLDANGAWTPTEAQAKLGQLAEFDVEFIEQPISPGQERALAELCQVSPIPIALDEELIGKPLDHQKFSLLEVVQPQAIVLKPTLLGGLGQTHQWVKMAEDQGILWWITSMLESNLGLNSIAQLAAQYRPVLPQGLGTGKIYTNNIPSPLQVIQGEMHYLNKGAWDFSSINFSR
jgi:o-succinylbenzoate synthase